MDITTIKDLMTIILFGISVWGWNRTKNQDNNKLTEQFTKLNWKMDENCRTLSSMDKAVEKLSDSVNNFSTRITLLEEQIKVANHRIQELEEKK